MAFSRGNLESLTNRHIVPKLADATFKGNPLLYWVRENRQVKLAGGRSIILPLIIKEGNFSWYDAGNTTTIDVIEPFNSAQAEWFWAEAPGALYETDIDKNGGDDGVINILEATREWLQETMTENMSDTMHGTNSSNALQSPGLQDMFGATGTSYLGLLDTDLSSPASWLTSIVTPLVAGTLDEHEMRRMRGTVTRGASRPNFGLCNFPVYNKIWKLVQTDQRFGMEKIARIGFDHVMFEDMPIMPDEHAPGSGYGTADNWLEFIDMDHMSLYIHENKAFAVRVYDPLPNQQAWIMKILVGLSFVTDNRRTHAVEKTINPSL